MIGDPKGSAVRGKGGKKKEDCRFGVHVLDFRFRFQCSISDLDFRFYTSGSGFHFVISGLRFQTSISILSSRFEFHDFLDLSFANSS